MSEPLKVKKLNCLHLFIETHYRATEHHLTKGWRNIYLTQVNATWLALS